MAGGVAANPSMTSGAPSTGQVTPSFMARAGDYGDQFSQTPDYYNPMGYGQSTLADYFANLPSYQQPGSSSGGNKVFAADLAAKSQTQATQQDAALKAAESERVRQSAEALKAYQTQLANQEWQRRLDAANSQLASLQAQQRQWEQDRASYSYDYGGSFNHAAGGLASLKGSDK